MAEKVVSVRLIARTEGFQAGMQKAKKSVDDLTKADVPKATRAYADLANKAALAGTAVAVGLGVAVKRFADFDQAMSAVKANVGGTASEMEALRAAAIKLGADSIFTATEAAQGINELGKAGLRTADILSGGLKGALDLAASGQIGVADAAETTATALTQFKLGGDQAVHIADLLAAGANKAQGGVGDLGAALKQAGLVAAGMGLSIEETTAGLTAFASAGAIGSDAGTAFKTMLQRLQAPIGDAKQMLDKYDISAYNAQGNFVGLANVAGQLQDRFKNLTPEVRDNALAVIFGQDAIRGARVLYEQGADGIRKWTDEVDQSGFAAKQAADLTDNLKGDLERLGGAFDSVLIETGSSANSSLRTIVQGLTGLVGVVSKIPGPVTIAGIGLSALALGLPKGIKVFREYKTSVETLGLSLDKVSAKAPRTGRALTIAAGGAKAFGIAATAAAVAGGVLSQFFDDNQFGVEELTGKLNRSSDSVGVLNDELARMAKGGPAYAKGLTTVGDVLDTIFNPDWNQKGVNAGSDFLSTITLGLVDLETKSDVAAKRLAGFDTVLAGMAANGNGERAAQIIEAIAAAQGLTIDQLTQKLPQYREAVAGVDNATRDATQSTEILGGSMDDVRGRLGEVVGQTDATSAAVLALGGAAQAASDDVTDLAKTIEQDMKAAANAFTGDLDVIGSYDPAKASDKVAKANKASEDAEKRLQQVRERIAGKKKTTVADTQALENATAKAAEARAARVKAADEANGQSLSEMYKRSVAEAKKFAANIQTATERGLDPAVVAKLLEAGPEQAGPILEQMVGAHGQRIIDMVNKSEAALGAINEQIVQQSRLTSIAVNASSDEIAGHLDEATRIVAQKAALGGEATAEQIAKKLKMGVPEVEQIAQEYGIALKENIPPEVGTYIKVHGVPDATDTLDLFSTAANNVPPEVGTYVRVTGAPDATDTLDLFHTSVTDVPDTKDVNVSTSGVPTTVQELVGVQTQLDLLGPKTVPVGVTGVPGAIAQIDALLRKLAQLDTPYTADTNQGGERAHYTRKAAGGAIYGAGTGTSDSIPALLSNGEHVWTAAEVARLGGQSAMYALRAAVRAGRIPAFAAGGAVQYAPPVQYVMGGPTSHSRTYDSRLMAEQVTIVTPDANSFRREIKTTPYRAKARPGR